MIRQYRNLVVGATAVSALLGALQGCSSEAPAPASTKANSTLLPTTPACPNGVLTNATTLVTTTQSTVQELSISVSTYATPPGQGNDVDDLCFIASVVINDANGIVAYNDAISAKIYSSPSAPNGVAFEEQQIAAGELAFSGTTASGALAILLANVSGAPTPGTVTDVNISTGGGLAPTNPGGASGDAGGPSPAGPPPGGSSPQAHSEHAADPCQTELNSLNSAATGYNWLVGTSVVGAAAAGLLEVPTLGTSTAGFVLAAGVVMAASDNYESACLSYQQCCAGKSTPSCAGVGATVRGCTIPACSGSAGPVLCAVGGDPNLWCTTTQICTSYPDFTAACVSCL